MSLMPAFQIGLWNAWILMTLYLLPMFLFSFGRKGRAKSKRLKVFVPIKHEKILDAILKPKELLVRERVLILVL